MIAAKGSILFLAIASLILSFDIKETEIVLSIILMAASLILCNIFAWIIKKNDE